MAEPIQTTNPPARKALTAERLRELLHYDPETGAFTWLVRRSSTAAPGKTAGKMRDGYLRIQIDGANYSAHHLAWIYVTGAWAAHEIDHRDTDPSNNRWRNLRPADRFGNTQNQKIRTDNHSGAKGVSWDSQRSRWMVCIRARRKTHRKRFISFAEAESYAAALRAVLHGEFARSF